MHHSFYPFAKRIVTFAVFAAVSVCSVRAQGLEQGDKEVEVTIHQKLERKGRLRALESGGVIDEKRFKEIRAMEKSGFLDRLAVDFTTQTLVVVGVSGDCFVRLSARITRDDEARKYLCRVQKIYGGCRAAGSFESWLVIEKLRPEYAIEFIAEKDAREW
jgi:hypothetical protein